MLAPARVPAAHAELGTCGSDPVVTLSDGTTLDLSAQIQDSAADVAQVAYSLHLPVGSAVVAWLPTNGPLGPRETVSVTADAAAGTYASATVVTTGQAHIAVQAALQVVSPLGVTLAAGAASGWDAQPLRVALTA